MNLTGGKILVIDDLDDWRGMVGGLLADAGFVVSTAANAPEALNLLGQQPYHVAIVDMRLDESDEKNKAGLRLAEDMRTRQPELAIIMLTGYADIPSVKYALQPREDGRSVAFDFLEKNEFNKLLPTIEKAFVTAAKVNPQLHIEFVGGLTMPFLKNSIECLQATDLQAASVEISDLLQRIFHKAQKIQVAPMNGGHSSASVVRVTPFARNIAQAAVVVKFNQRSKADIESQNYVQYVSDYVGGARRTLQLDFRSTARLGGISYSFVGAQTGQFRRFNQVYAQSSVKSIKQVLTNLFQETCYPWYTQTLSPNPTPQSLGADYKKWLRLHPSKIARAAKDTVEQSDRMLEFTRPGKPTQSDIFFGDRGVNLQNPLPLSQAALAYSGPYSLTHGDLHEGNVLVDNYNQTWLIDFYHTGPAHPVRDFAILESAIKFSLQQSDCSLNILYDWERSLLKSDSLLAEPLFDPPLQLDAELQKATTVIIHIRQLAGQILPEMTMRDYLISLYFHALKAMTLPRKFSRRQRLHALISASLVREVLSG